MMNLRNLPVASAFFFALATTSLAHGQVSASAPAAQLPASAPVPVKPPPRLLSPAEKRDSANAATRLDDSDPVGPVKPQLSIPIGRTPPPPSPAQERAVRRSGTAATTGIDDAAARCAAEADEPARDKCLSQARASKPR